MTTLQIKFLKAGVLEVPAPADYKTMSLEEKVDWANEVLRSKSDEEIIQALADMSEKEAAILGTRFEGDSLYTEAIHTADLDVGYANSVVWDLYENDTTGDWLVYDSDGKLIEEDSIIRVKQHINHGG